jgi:hypothetical protein
LVLLFHEQPFTNNDNSNGGEDGNHFLRLHTPLNNFQMPRNPSTQPSSVQLKAEDTDKGKRKE